MALLMSSTEVIKDVSWVAVSAKLTTPMRLPLPISPEDAPPVASAMMSTNASAPFFILVNASPVILPERSSTRTMSVGFVIISGDAVSDNVTSTVPSHKMLFVLTVLLAKLTPTVMPPFKQFYICYENNMKVLQALFYMPYIRIYVLGG